MAPVVGKKMNTLKALDLSLDGGRTMGAQKIFGSHKTVRGLVLGVLAGAVTSLAQNYLLLFIPQISRITLFDFSNKSALVWGLLLGFGALFGDLVKSFIKRRMAITEGSPWIPWDQLDMVFGALLFGSFYHDFVLHNVLIAIILSPVLILGVNALGTTLKIKERI